MNRGLAESRKSSIAWHTIAHSLRLDHVVVAVLVLALAAFYLRSVAKWWFEDDPLYYSTVARVSAAPWGGLRFFFDRSALTALGAGKMLVPMRLLSHWLDVMISGYSPGFAYAHALVAWLATALMLHAVLVRWTAGEGLPAARAVSLGATMLWALLPSTLVVHQYLAARHYMEGLLCALAAIYLAMGQPGRANPGDSRGASRGLRLRFAAMMALAAVAMLFEEVFALALPCFLLLYGLGRGSVRLVVVSVTLVVGYALYRMALFDVVLFATSLEAAFGQGMPFLGAKEYVGFLGVWPYLLAANWGGVLIYAAIAGLTAVAILFPRGESRRAALLVSALAAAILIAIYPSSYAVSMSYALPTLWYRLAFVFHTLAVVWGGYLAARYLTGNQQALALLIVLVIVLPGADRTRQVADEQMMQAEVEAAYYLKHPDRLLLSERPFWFLVGVDAMYGAPVPHFVSAREITSDHAKQMVNQFPTIWRYEDGEYVQDDELYRTIREANGL